jgi:hypothetical protein
MGPSRADFAHVTEKSGIIRTCWLGFLDTFRTLCIDPKGEICSTFEAMRNSWTILRHLKSQSCSSPLLWHRWIRAQQTSTCETRQTNFGHDLQTLPKFRRVSDTRSVQHSRRGPMARSGALRWKRVTRATEPVKSVESEKFSSKSNDLRRRRALLLLDDSLDALKAPIC